MAWHGYSQYSASNGRVTRSTDKGSAGLGAHTVTGARTLIRKNQTEEKKEKDAIKIKLIPVADERATQTAKGS